MLSDVCVGFDIMAHIMSVPCHEGPPATKGHISSEPAVAGRGRYYCISILLGVKSMPCIVQFEQESCDVFASHTKSLQ